MSEDNNPWTTSVPAPLLPPPKAKAGIQEPAEVQAILRDESSYKERLNELLEDEDDEEEGENGDGKDAAEGGEVGDDDEAVDIFSSEDGEGDKQEDGIAEGDHIPGKAFEEEEEDEDDEEELGEFNAAQIKVDQDSQYTPSAPSINERAHERSGSPFLSPTSHGASPYKRPPYLHPSVSRLRSHFRNPSSSTISSTAPDPYSRLGPSPSPRSAANLGTNGHARTPSLFSDVSRRSSFYASGAHTALGAMSGANTNGLPGTPVGKGRQDGLGIRGMNSPAGTSDVLGAGGDLLADGGAGEGGAEVDNGWGGKAKLLPAFRWQTLKKASDTLFLPSTLAPTNGEDTQSPRRAGSLLSRSAAPPFPMDNRQWGQPTCMAVNGMLAIGTTGGFAIVFSFSQELKHVLGSASTSKDAGAVSTIRISPDQTFVAVGHEQGYIYLYDLANPGKPARQAPPLALQALLSGRKEGHLIGTRIVTVDFVGKRHTAVISGDASGRAFWWSLGKVMGVESNDVVRLLGNMPLQPSPDMGEAPVNGSPSRPGSIFGGEGVDTPRGSKHHRSILAAAPLPLGPRTHFSDLYSLMALLTPSKLVIVGLQPSARTWYRKLRKRNYSDDSHIRGCAVWLPAGAGDLGLKKTELEAVPPSKPALAFSWGRKVELLTITMESDGLKDGRKGGESDPLPSSPVFIEAGSFTAEREIVSMQWYNPKHLLLLTETDLLLLDIRLMKVVEQVPLPGRRTKSSEALALSTYKGRLFLLTPSKIGLGSLSSWADRILALCDIGDYLGAIELATAYYHDTAPGNRIGLPEDLVERKTLLKQRMLSLMQSSLDYAFAEERMTDGSYHTAGSAGVDLTSLFENLATTCFRACSAMEEMNFAYEDVYERYQQTGIDKLYLERLELFIYEDQRQDVPPNLVQALIQHHYDSGEYQQAEDLIWQVDPATLDVNQSIRICEEKRLWDALIYVHNRCLRDFVSPLLYIARLMQRTMDLREQGPKTVGEVSNGHATHEDLEKNAYEAYKLYSYLEKALSGLSYPDGRFLPDDLAGPAREDIYGYLFAGKEHLSMLPSSDTKQKPLRGEDVLRIILKWDPEAFLHALDIAFEDPFLNDAGKRCNVSRQIIVNTLLELVRASSFHQGDITFLYIFIARNIPKYPQFLVLPPSTTRFILDGLASDEDQSTLEDRELAAEFLLSRHTPQDAETLYALFDKAGFFRILETVYRKQSRWAALIDVLVRDPAATLTVFGSLEDVFLNSQANATKPNPEVLPAITKALPVLLQMSIPQTAVLLDRNAPSLHQASLDLLHHRPADQLAYFRSLLEPALFVDDHEASSSSLPPRVTASTHVTEAQKLEYLQLLLVHEPSSVIESLSSQPVGFYPLEELLPLCAELPQVSVWVLNKMDEPTEALTLVADTVHLHGYKLARILQEEKGDPETSAVDGGVEAQMLSIQQIIQSGVGICKERSKAVPASPDQLLRELWLTVLEAEVRLVRTINESRVLKDATSGDGDLDRVTKFVRNLIQDTFTSLISSSSTTAVPFPDLFKRLVESARADDSRATGTAYAEFRVILTSMLSSYSGEGESLRLASRIFGVDLHDLMQQLLDQQAKGWKPVVDYCEKCQAVFVIPESRGKHRDVAPAAEESGVLISASGSVSHVLCPTTA